MYAIKRLLHHFVRHLLSRWGLAYYFCSADALQHIFVVTQSAAAFVLRYRSTLPSAAPQTAWRSSGAFREQSVSSLLKRWVQEIQSSFLNSKARKYKPAVAPPASFYNLKIPRRGFGLLKKDKRQVQLLKLCSAINQPSAANHLSSSYHPVIYLFCADTLLIPA